MESGSLSSGAHWRDPAADPGGALRAARDIFVSRPQKAVDLTWRHRPADQVALHIGAAVGGDAGHLLLGFDTFRDRRDPETLAERGDSADDGPADGVVCGAANEGLVDLDPVEWKVAQVTQRRIPDAKIIQRDAHADFTNILQHRERRPPGIEHHAFGSLEFQTLRVEAAFAERRHDRRDQIWALELDRRNIDGNLLRAAPACRLEAGGPNRFN